MKTKSKPRIKFYSDGKHIKDDSNMSLLWQSFDINVLIWSKINEDAPFLGAPRYIDI